MFALSISTLFALCNPVHAIVAGDPNPPKDSNGQPLYPADSPSNRVDPNTTSSPFAGIGEVDGGTAILLDSTHVLTAAHVVYGHQTGFPVIFSYGGDGNISIPVNDNWYIPPQFPGYLNSSDAYDFAVLTLSVPAPAGMPTYSLYTGPLSEGTVVTLVGYGATGDGVNGYSTGLSSTIKRIGEQTVEAYIAPDGSVQTTFSSNAMSYLFDFHAPTGFNNPPTDPLNPSGTSLGNTVETTLGDGDSGGPAFVQVNGQYEVAAMNNFVDQWDTTTPTWPLFGSGGGGPIISYYSNLIDAAVPEPESTTSLALLLTMLFGLLVFSAAKRKSA